MTHAEKCPVCETQKPHQVESEYSPVTCRGCDGKGWVEVSGPPPLYAVDTYTGVVHIVR